MTTLCFYNAYILRNHHFEKGELWIADGKIIQPGFHADHSIDVQGNLIAPGYIDIQLNGGFGIDFIQNPEKVNEVAKQLGQFGVTGFLATVVTSSLEQYRKTLPILCQYIEKNDGASLIGLHLEGPCINPSNAGAHEPAHIRPCSDFKTPEECYGSLEGVKMVTLAPEVNGAIQWIEWLQERGIISSVGHSSASFEEFQKSLDAGLSCATHLFNAMSPFHHRNPSIVQAILTTPHFYYSIIADGLHVHPSVVKLAWKCQSEGLFLVSDAVSALGKSVGDYQLGTKTIEIRQEGIYIKGKNILGGANLGLDGDVRNLVQFTGADEVKAIEAASYKPALLLGLYPSRGCLEVGSNADLTILNKNLEVLSTYVGGGCIFTRSFPS